VNRQCAEQASIWSGALTAIAGVSPSGPSHAYLCGRVNLRFYEA